MTETQLTPVDLTVIGSINVDLIARVERLPRPGETVSAFQFVRAPGGRWLLSAIQQV